MMVMMFRRVASVVTSVTMVGALGSAAFSGTYVVRSGDTLSGVASRFGVSLPALAEANQIADANRILVGERLVIPGSAVGGYPNFPARLRVHPSRLKLLPVFRHWASAYGVPAGLLESVAWMESGWQASVVSSTGAVGVMQIEPGTAVFISHDLLGLYGVLPRRDPNSSIRMGAAYLHWLLGRANGNVSTAVGGYYQGLLSVERRGPLLETQLYVKGVKGLWLMFRSG
jgi:soluble lytic murein transglycosylase-like protein